MQTLGANKSGSIGTYIIMCLLISISGSLFNPVLSLYLNTELGLDPIYISIFFVLLPIATILVVQTVGKFSDLGLERPMIICLSSIFGVASAYVLYLRPSYLVLCTIGLLCLACYPVAFPQIFASAREFAAKKATGSLMFTTFLRSLTSLAWVVGPPLAYAVVNGYSFNTLFFMTAIMFALGGIFSYLILPNVAEQTNIAEIAQIKWWHNRSVVILCISFCCLFMAFLSYIISMPLFVTQELKLSPQLPGYLLGLAAFIEIPIMFAAAKLSRLFGLKVIVIVGAFCLVIFLIAMQFAYTEEHLYSLQFLHSLFIGLLGIMGMVLFQDLLPQIPGQATSLYVNSTTAGQILGGAFIALASSGSYRTVFLAGLIMSVIGTVLLFFVKRPQHNPT